MNDYVIGVDEPNETEVCQNCGGDGCEYCSYYGWVYLDDEHIDSMEVA